MKSKVIAGVLVFASIATAAWSIMGQSQRGARVSYEYQVIDDFANHAGAEEGFNKLNRLGAQGWEVVAVTTETPNFPGKIWLKRVRR